MPTRALSLHACHAVAILQAGKNVENRSWCPNAAHFGTRIAIHAGSNPGSAESRERIRARMGSAAVTWPRQALIGTARLLGTVCWDDSGKPRYTGLVTESQAVAALESEWWGGPYGWVLDDPQPLATPIGMPGRLGLWKLPPEAIAQLTVVL